MTDAQLAQVLAWLRDHMPEIHSVKKHGGDRRELVEGLAEIMQKARFIP